LAAYAHLEVIEEVFAVLGSGKFPGVEMLCPKCAFANQETAAFCGRCGISLGGDLATPEVKRHAERRRLTVMFCDLVGSTELAGQIDPEELHDLTRQYQSVCATVVGRHAGHVAQFLGDGLLVFFGYPVGHEDDAQRAVRAGLDIVVAVSGLQARAARPLQVRVAVHTGLVVVGNLGDGSNPDALAVVGETPNIAARLQNLAEPDTVIISSPTYRLVEGFFNCRSLGTPALRGVAQPIELYRVLGESDIQSRFERAVAIGLTPFVSREAEVEVLLKRWQRAREGAGQVILLSGEAGIGKTRLVQMLKQRTGGEPVTELTARCSPYYQDSALYPLIAFLERYLLFKPNDPPENKRATLERVLEFYGFPLPEFLPLFCALLSLPNDGRYPAPTMTPQRQKQKTFEAIVAWLLKEAQQRPIWIVVEDIHWADPSTLELLTLLIEQTAHSKLFVVVIFRSEFLPPWRSQPHVTSMTLDRLPAAATQSMIERLAGSKRLPPEVIREIAGKTEGVPLFVEELTRMVLESGQLRESDERYELASALPSLAIPSTLYESLMARLDRLGPAKEVAQVAATIGKEFSFDLLRATSSLDEAELTAALNQLVDAELLEQRLLSFQRSYSFRHALIRDAAYESLLRSKRRQYHGKVAAALQDGFPDVVNANPELIAVHYTDAGMLEEAVGSWQRAGQRALERSANQEAIRHLTKGLDSLKLLPESPQHFQQELMLQISLGTALIATKGFASPEVGAVYARAREICQQAGDTLQLFPVLWGLWVFYTARAEHIVARELAEQCLRLAEGAGDRTLLVEAHHALGVTLTALAEFAPALKDLEFVIAEHHSSQYDALLYGQDPKVVCLSQAAWTLWIHGYPERALRRNEEAIALARRLSHPYSLAAALGFGAMVHQLCQDGPATQRFAEAGIALSTEREFVYWAAWSCILQGWALAHLGDLEKGILQIREGLGAFRATGAQVMVPYFLGILAEALGKAGEAKEGLTLLAEAQAVIDRGGERWWETEIHRLKGELMILQFRSDGASAEDSKAAEDHFFKSLNLASHQRAKSLELRAAMSLNRLWMKRGRKIEAQRILSNSYGWFTEGFETADLEKAKTLMRDVT
jgi:predicted ATPase/class 3 adenylate cyclase